MTQRCYIGLGSNLDNPARQLREAIAQLAALPDCELQARSGFYRNPALGPGEQPDYLNAVVCLDTRLKPLPLLEAMQGVEQAQGRQRKPGLQWAARTLDLDLLLYDQQLISSERLTVPHPRMLERRFVLVPLLEIEPSLRMPDGRPLTSALAALNDGHWLQREQDELL